jgi:MFS family permease
MLYAFALVFGIADAFFFPAVTSITPSLVPGEQLGQANAIVQGTSQLTVFVGPALAGLLIAVFGSTGAGQPSVEGIGIALLIDAATFIVSIGTLWLIRRGVERPAEEDSSVIESIREGVRFVWSWPSMRLIVLLSMGANLLVVGPFEVGIPVLAYTRLPEGAAAFGLMASAFGLGSVAGLGAAAALPAPKPAWFGTIALGAIAIAGALLAVTSIVYATVPALIVAFLIGVFLGYSNLLTITWIQRRVPGKLMGRVMSLMMIGSLGLVPVSMMIAGVFAQANLSALLLTGGMGMTVLAALSLLSQRIRAMGTEPVLDLDNDAAAVSALPSPA